MSPCQKTAMKLIRKYTAGIYAINALIIFLFPLTIFAQDAVNNCVDCHKDLEGILAAPVTQMENDIHFKRGIMCVDCHGGDSRIDPQGDQDIAMDPQKGYTGAIPRTEVPQFCDSCHGNAEYMRSFNPNLRVDQYQRYKTSIHGQRLEEGGDEKVAVCTDCHAIHEMRSVNVPLSKVYPLHVSETCGNCHSDPEYMQPYNISTDQVELYKTSVHYEFLSEKGDMSAPTCNDCHGNHGAVPPGVESIHFVCGFCHASAKDLFSQSAHFQAFKDMDLPECATCHLNHDIIHTGEFMLNTNDGICWMCHDTDSDEGITTITITSEIEVLKQLSAQADSLITLAEVKGMEVSEYKFKLIDLTSNITRARNLVHTLSDSMVREETQSGKELAETIIKGGINAMAEISRRRTGLFIFLLFILFTMFALYLKIRKLPNTLQEEKITQ